MSDPSDRALSPLLSLRGQFSEGWERSLVDISLRALSDRGVEGLRALQTSIDDPDVTRRVEMVNRTLSLRDASDFLALLQTREADRLDRSREILRKALGIATVAAEELLRVALGGKL